MGTESLNRLSFFNGRSFGGAPLSFRVEDGRFCDLGAPPDETSVDLGGGTVLPGFVDSHCHIVPLGLDMLKLSLAGLSSRDAVIEAVGSHARECPDPWIQAVHYDQTRFDDAQHLSRFELDAVVADRPVILRHSNGHASVANTAALEAAGIAPTIADPPGGTYVRDASGQLTGVLLERAHEHVTAKAPQPTEDDLFEAVMRAGRAMAALGITSATDMMTGRWNLEAELRAYARASRSGCPVRLRLYAQWATVLGPRGIDKGLLGELMSAMDKPRCRLNGLKIFADGAVGSATAAIYGEYLTTGEGGQLIYPPERFHSMVQMADQQGWQLAVHSIGDLSTDLVMDAYSQTSDPRRHRLEHAMILSDGQISRLASLGCEVTMQPEFLLRFGHAYEKQLGSERARRIKRFRSVLHKGIPLSFSSDRPIVPGDPWDGIAMAVARPNGFDPSENLTLAEAIDLYTTAGARVNLDPDMGRIDAGCHADFQVYDGAPSRATLREVWSGGHRVTPED